MTDPHDNDLDHDHAGEAAHDQGERGDMQKWEGHDAPADDFHDMESDGAAMISEESAAGHEHDHDHDHDHEQQADGDAGQQVVEQKKRNLLLPAAAVAGGVLVLGAFLYWQFGTSHSSDTVPIQMAQNPINAPAPIVKPAPAPAPVADNPPGDPVAAKTGLIPPTVVPPVTDPTPAVASVAPPAANPQNTPVAAVASAPPAPAATAAAVAATETRLNGLSNRMDDMQHSLEQAVQKLNDVSDKLASQAAMPPPAPTIPPALEDRLSKVEQRLIQMEQHPVKTTAPSFRSDRMASTSRHIHHAAQTASRRLQAGIRKAHKVIASAKTAKPVKTGKTSPENSRWVLRAASPNEAWVATDDTTSDLRAVHVGDDLPGVGRITAIRDQGGVWILQGANGAVE